MKIELTKQELGLLEGVLFNSIIKPEALERKGGNK